VWGDKTPVKHAISALLDAARQKLTEQKAAMKTKAFSENEGAENRQVLGEAM
jgi:hypothetical protein